MCGAPFKLSHLYFQYIYYIYYIPTPGTYVPACTSRVLCDRDICVHFYIYIFSNTVYKHYFHDMSELVLMHSMLGLNS